MLAAPQYYPQGYPAQQAASSYPSPPARHPQEAPKNYIQVSAHDFRDSAVVALKSILGLLRIASKLIEHQVYTVHGT